MTFAKNGIKDGKKKHINIIEKNDLISLSFCSLSTPVFIEHKK